MTDTSKTILVVEDEKAYSHTINEKLRSEGFTVLLANNGEEGLAMALEKHPDLILLDIQMPKMDGIEMVKRLRKDEWGKKAKIIILSNINSMEKTQQALENEVFQYLIKSDIKIDDLVDRINSVLK